jgi:hypothetical protein
MVCEVGRGCETRNLGRNCADRLSGVPEGNGIHLHARRVGTQGGVNRISGLGTLEAAELKGDCRTVWNTDSQATSSREPAEGIERLHGPVSNNSLDMTPMGLMAQILHRSRNGFSRVRFLEAA